MSESEAKQPEEEQAEAPTIKPIVVDKIGFFSFFFLFFFENFFFLLPSFPPYSFL
jgi:hypothetical protein